MTKKMPGIFMALLLLFFSCQKNESPSSPETQPSSTPVISATATVSPTITDTATEGDTPTFTYTPTLTPSSTESSTLSPTNTLTNTRTSTPTMTPTVYQWETVGSGTISSSYTIYNDMYINGGIIYVSYQHGESGMPLYVKQYDGSWAGLDGGDGKIQDGGSYTNVFYDSKPYIAFGDGGVNMPTAMYYSGVSWTTIASAQFSDSASGDITLYSYGGTPYVGYMDDDSAGPGTAKSATVKKYNSAADTWDAVGSRQFTSGQVNGLKIHGYQDVLYVLYSDISESGEASVMKYDPSGAAAWEYVGSRGFSDWEILYPAIFVYNNVPYVAFRDSGNGEKLTVMKYTGSGTTGWEPIGGVGISPGTISYTALYVYNGDIYAAYGDWNDNYRLKVIKWPSAGSAWVQVGPPVSSAGAGYPVLFVDSGVPYIFFGDGADGSKGIVKKYDPQ